MPEARQLVGRFTRLGPLTQFGVIGLCCFIALGVGLHQLIARDVAARAVDHDREAVEFLADLLGERGQPLDSPGAAVTIDQFLELDHHGPEYLAVRVWDARLRLVRGPAASSRDVIGARLRRAALDGRPGGRRHDAVTDRASLLHYAVPVQRPGAGVVGVLEVTQRSDGVDEAVLSTTRKLTVLMAGGLAVLYLVLFRLLRRTSRRLRAHAAELARIAVTDEVTGLPNRHGLERRLHSCSDRPVAVVLVRVGDLHAAYALHGMERGDDLARTVAVRMVRIASTAVVARLASDEFAILLDDCAEDRAAEIAHAACAALAQDAGSGRPPHAGVACRAGGGRRSEDVLMRANAALAAALRAGVPVRLYRPGQELELRGLAEEREEIEAVLADPGAIDIVVQPIICLVSGEILSYEALARFTCEPRRGPDVWFAQAHRVGLGVELETRAALDALRLEGRPVGTRLSINASPAALTSPTFLEALPDDLAGVIVELTEHQLADHDALEGPLAELRSRGAGIAVDDTGAGYAGLQQVMRIAPDTIKLDRQLVSGIDASPTKVALVEAFVRFARRSHALLCAEGVETIQELTTLADLDVGAGQGYGIARPGPAWPEVADEVHRACRAGLDAALAPVTRVADQHDAGHLETTARRLASAQSLDDVARIVEPLAAALHADEVAISLHEPETDELVTISSHAWQPTSERYRLRDFPATRAVLEEGHALQVLLSDRTADPRELDVLARSGHRSALVVPITWRGAAVGIVEAYATEARAWSRSEILRARTVCHQLGSVIAALTPDSAPPATRPAVPAAIASAGSPPAVPACSIPAEPALGGVSAAATASTPKARPGALAVALATIRTSLEP